MSKVLVIGIDGMDSVLLEKYEQELPHLTKLKQASPRIKPVSVFPPDSQTAWASIYTGLNPTKHGILFFVDPLDRISVVAFRNVDNTPIKGRTFWDIAGDHGKKVCVLLPELGYPVWPVNGVMIGKSHQRYGDDQPFQAFPNFLLSKYDFQSLLPIRTTPQEKFLPQYVEAHQNLIVAESEFGLQMLKLAEWDLFFMYSSALDWMGHELWRYFDEDDPSYPGPNQFQDVSRNFYRLYDQMIGRFMDAATNDTAIIVLSDHGQCKRPVRLLNINEMLRTRGFLTPKIKHASLADPYYLMEIMKKKVTNFVNKRGVGENLLRLIHLFPASKKIYTAPLSIDWRKTMAYVSDLSGIKAYYYGGIIIKKENLQHTDYEELRTLLINELGEIRDPESGEIIVKWVRRREDLYSGEFISQYPDIIFVLREDYGAGWALYDSLFSKCYTHNIQPGSHRIETPIFLMSNINTELARQDMTLMDIAPSVLHLLGMKDQDNFDGKSIFKG